MTDLQEHAADRSTDSDAARISKRTGSRTLRITLSILKWIVIVGWFGGIIAGAIVTGYVSALVKDEEVRSRDTILNEMQQNSETGFVYFRDGTVVGQLRTEEDRRLIEYSDIPKIVEDAVLATEDDRFYEHIGIDMTSLMRAVKQKALKEDVQTGGSTITQQVARRVFLNLEKTDSRKVKEIFLSLRLERYMTKEEILAAYLNKIPYGNGSSGYNLYGIKAAAKGIFDKELNQLNIAEAAYLAGLPQQPSIFSAFTGTGEFDPEGFRLAKERQELVLSRMLSTGKITKAEYDEALRFDLRSNLAESSAKAYTTYPYLMLEAERHAAEILLKINNPDLTDEELYSSEYAEALKDARDQLLRGGYKVYTTIDPQVYDAMHRVSENPDNFTKDHEKKGVEQVGGMLIDNNTGAILGMIEGRDFKLEQLNHATQAKRQPGSAMKPIAAFLPALESGAIQPGSIIDDVPIILPDYSKGVHIPQNWDGRYHGLMTAREALNQSWNIPALKIFLDYVTIPKAWEFAQSIGITTITESDYHASTGVIGGLEYGVSVEELTNAYAAIANNGNFLDAYLIEKITDSNNTVIYEHAQTRKKVFSEQTAYLMTDMLKTALTNGTGSEVRRVFEHEDNIPIVGKTGTTSDNHDLWFVGYSPDVTLGVWIGYDRPAPLTNSHQAKRIWAKVMNEVVESKPDLFATEQFEKPDNIVAKTVSAVSGLLPSELVLQEKLTITDIFNRKYIPTKQDDVFSIASVVKVDDVPYLPQAGTPEDMTRTMRVVKRAEPIFALLKRIEEATAIQNPSERKSLDRYRPTDGFGDMPEELDPRVEDGKDPSPPPKLTIIKTGEDVKVMFTPSYQRDVAGYRVYRTEDGASFHPLTTVLTGEAPSFIDKGAANRLYGYYIVAVDIGGRISQPSDIAYTGEPVLGPLQNPDDGGSPVEGNNPNPSGTAAEPPTAPQQPVAEARELGVRLSWPANPAEQAVERYHVYYSASEQGPYEQIRSVKGQEFYNISLNAAGWYRITASNAAGESPPSISVSFQP